MILVRAIISDVATTKATSSALQAVGGEEILNRQHLKPMHAKSGASFVLTLPASQDKAGDYMLTLRGYMQSGELEDVSQSLFRVEKKR